MLLDFWRHIFSHTFFFSITLLLRTIAMFKSFILQSKIILTAKQGSIFPVTKRRLDWNKIMQKYIHVNEFIENASDCNLFRLVAVYSFTIKGLHVRWFLSKFVKVYQNLIVTEEDSRETVFWFPATSGVSPVLLPINQLSHSWLPRTSRKSCLQVIHSAYSKNI